MSANETAADSTVGRLVGSFRSTTKRQWLVAVAISLVGMPAGIGVATSVHRSLGAGAIGAAVGALAGFLIVGLTAIAFSTGFAFGSNRGTPPEFDGQGSETRSPNAPILDD